ncbi:MAG: hypothetical protein ACP5D7_19935 [Limnospira sp.]
MFPHPLQDAANDAYSNCGFESCCDTNAALNILKRGMEMLGMEWWNSTGGHPETAGKPETSAETSA